MLGGCFSLENQRYLRYDFNLLEIPLQRMTNTLNDNNRFLDQVVHPTWRALTVQEVK